LFDRLWVDLDGADLPASVGRGLHDAPAGRHRYRLLRQLRLNLRQPPLHLLTELEQVR
jgi:hypothetical protein